MVSLHEKDTVYLKREKALSEPEKACATGVVIIVL